MRVAFIGLGTMGFPMAGHLVAAGHEVTVFNRTTATAEAWADRHGGAVGATPAEAARRAEVVCTCVGGDDDVRAVLYGADGALAGLAPGGVVVDHTTASAELAREVAARAGEIGVGAVDAPVSGGQSGAEAGRLSVMCGGQPEALDRARPAIEAYAASITRIGPAGTGQLTKMANQILCAAALEGAAEALAFAELEGLDPDRVLAAVTGGAATSWYLEHRGPTMVRDEFDFGFAVDWFRKDLRIALAEAERIGASLPVTARALADYDRLHERGDGALDVSVAIRLRRHEAERARRGADS
jgi:3-hydroxyisobutyrate dehydrogenase